MRRRFPDLLSGLLAILLTASSALAAAPQRPDFSGRWAFDREKSMKPGPDGRIVLATIMGDEFVATQDATALALAITAGSMNVTAVYKLDGSESRNTSPGAAGQPDIAVVSRASWEGNRLVILSTSTSVEQGREVTLETRRLIYLEDGDLVIERTGTPPELVKWSRSVYRRVR